jgi:DNA primase
VAGRIRDEDIAELRERAPIDEVVSAYVTLRNAGSGSQKGLCPFHDEKTPSFTVTPARQYFHCFGCGQGGDVLSFVQQVEGLSFVEAVEKLAARFGVELHYVEGGPRTGTDHGQRQRLMEANRLAQQFYAAQLAETEEAVIGRRFLSERGFDQEVSDRFGVGYAPRSGEALLRHLRGRDVRDEDMVAAGVVARGARGLYDRFRGRLLWPIRELSGEVVGFGARRLHDDDRIEAKYLNTPDTALYKKSHLLYGVDLARREIARSQQAVVVEGYTDVMACHLSGVPTAVATCGTAFGPDHARILRRLLLDHDEFRGEVIFTFDGDEAGRRAALKAFAGDQQFVAQTYVAVEPSGKDPCDLRLSDGEAAVRELVARRVPLYRFVLRNVVDRFDLDRADGRIDAVREAAGLVASVRDRSKVDAFARELAGMVGVEPDEVRAVVRQSTRRGDGREAPARASAVVDPSGPTGSRPARRRRERLPPSAAAIGVGGHRRGAAARAGRCAMAGRAASARGAAGGAHRVATGYRTDPGVDRAGRAAGLRSAGPAAGADRRAAHRRGQVEAATHQPRRAHRGVQPDVRRARRPRAAPPAAARADHRSALSSLQVVHSCLGAPVAVARHARTLLAVSTAARSRRGRWRRTAGGSTSTRSAISRCSAATR